MGLVRFSVHAQNRITPEFLDRVYLAGVDLVPWQARVFSTADGFAIERSVGDSGYAFVPWRVPGFGELIISTATLVEQPRPYLLEVELARGKLHQVREQTALWQSIGLAVPEALSTRIRQATGLFAQAVSRQHEPPAAARLAEESLAESLAASQLLAACYTQQGLVARHRSAERFDVLLGAHCGHQPLAPPVADLLRDSFNCAWVGFNWLQAETGEGQYAWDTYDRQLAWCRANGLKVLGGPLLQLDPYGLPDWLYLWEDDYDSIVSFVEQHVRTTVTRYRGQVDFWECVGRINAPATLGMSEDEKLRLVVRTFELVRQLDPQTPLLVRFDQPWSEYLTHAGAELSSLQLADALARSGLGLAGITLEINLSYYPGGTPPRDWLDFSRLIDVWGLIGVPLYLALTCPSSDQPDPLARRETRPLPEGLPGGYSESSQQSWVERLVRLVLVKTNVRGIFWSQLYDSQPHEFPHGGLINAAGRAKPLVKALAATRKAHLA